jgi:hypothetical protein
MGGFSVGTFTMSKLTQETNGDLKKSDQTARFLAMPGWGRKRLIQIGFTVLFMFLDRREEPFFFHFGGSPISFCANKWHHSPQEYPTFSSTTDTNHNNCNYSSYYGFNDIIR